MPSTPAQFKETKMKRRKFETKADVFPSVPVNVWKPAPDMGTVKAPPPEDSMCVCKHKSAVHYGSAGRWCNTGGCDCQFFADVLKA
jgi:hypothetical protein